MYLLWDLAPGYLSEHTACRQGCLPATICRALLRMEVYNWQTGGGIGAPSWTHSDLSPCEGAASSLPSLPCALAPPDRRLWPSPAPLPRALISLYRRALLPAGLILFQDCYCDLPSPWPTSLRASSWPWFKPCRVLKGLVLATLYHSAT